MPERCSEDHRTLAEIQIPDDRKSSATPSEAKRQPFLELGWVILGQLGLAVGYILGVKLLSTVLDVEAFGRFSLGLTLINFVQLVLFTPLAQGLMRYWSVCLVQAKTAAFHRIAGRWMFRLVLGTLSGAGFLMVGGLLFHQSQWIAILGLSLAAGAFGGCVNSDIVVLNANRDRKTSAGLSAVSACLKPLAGLLMAVIWLPTAESALMGYGVASFVMMAVSRKLVLSRMDGVGSHSDGDMQILSRSMFDFCWPFLPIGIFSWIQQSADRWALQLTTGAEAVGRFAVVSQLAFYPMVFVAGVLQLFFMPIAYARAERSSENPGGTWRVLHRLVAMFVMLAGGMVAVFGWLSESLVLLISRSTFVGYHAYLPSIGIGWGLYYLGVMLSGFGFTAKASRLYLVSGGGSAIVAAAGCIIGASRYGPSGVVWGLCFSGGLYAVWNGWIACRIIRMWGRPPRFANG